MSTYEISKSSLVSLKAEILRKQQELLVTKNENEIKKRNLKRNVRLELKNKNIDRRIANDIVEDEDLLKKSKEMLISKAKIYDKLSQCGSNISVDSVDFSSRYLVRFENKIVDYDQYEPAKNSDEEWVEYVDCLGRSRTCLRKDLEYIKSRDEDLKLIAESRQKSECRSLHPNDETQSSIGGLLKNDNIEDDESDSMMKKLKEEWEKQEEELKEKSNIHYQDILFNEARTHGVGYYAFSKDEEERFKQQEALKKLREETVARQKHANELKEKRKKQLADRVRAAKNRKRIRLGLSPLDDNEEDEEAVSEKQSNPEEKDDKIEDKDADEKEKELERKRKAHLRPWDIGKKPIREHYEYTQEEWVDKKRRERPNEFAPFEEKSKSSSSRHHHSSHRNKRKDKRKSNSDSDEAVSDSIEAGLKFLRQQIEKTNDNK